MNRKTYTLIAVTMLICMLAGCGADSAVAAEPVLPEPANTPSESAVIETPTASVTIEAAPDETDAPDIPEEVWGDLQAAEGQAEWDTLTEAQQDAVNYPAFDESSVHWTPNGGSYHAVDWCYTLSNSSHIINGTLEEAIEKGKDDPCSKCVGH